MPMSRLSSNAQYETTSHSRICRPSNEADLVGQDEKAVVLCELSTQRRQILQDSLFGINGVVGFDCYEGHA